MKELDAINLVLRNCGKPAINEVTDSDGDAALVQGTLRRERRKTLAAGFPFNTNRVTLSADVSGKIPIDKSFLKILLPDANLSYRDDGAGNLFIWDVRENVYWTTAVTNVWVTFDIEDYTLIPELFMEWIARQSAAEFYHEVNQQASSALEFKAERAKAKAMNSLPAESVTIGTGWAGLQNYRAGIPINVGGAWLYLN